MKASTRAVHAGVERQKADYALTTPIIQSATYTFKDTADLTAFMQDKFWRGNKNGRDEYARYGNPTVLAAERKLAALEGGDDALLYASGMAAITSVLLASLPTGAHVILTDNCYHGTWQFCMTFLKRLGIETTMVPLGDYEALEDAIIPKQTRFIISESPTNPHLRLVDFERLVEIAQRHKIRTMIDATFGTPLNQKPVAAGIDFVVHSATKYLGGHHDLLAGVVIGQQQRINALREAQTILGAVVSPETAFLLERGLKTVSLRMERHNQNAMAIAQYLEKHPKIQQVWYPGLPSHSDYELACKQMTAFGGVVTFEVASDMAGTGAFIDALQIPYIAASLGGVESLIEQPVLMSHFGVEPEQRTAQGITDNLVRFAVGIEDTEDLIADLEQALQHV